MFEFKILSENELYETLVDYENEDPYEILHNYEKKIKYFGFNDSFHYDKSVRWYFCCFDGDILAGVLKLKIGGSDSFSNPGWCNWVSFVSVNNDYFGNGIGKKLVESCFTWCKENDISVLMSAYSLRGFIHLRPYIIEMAIKFGLNFRDFKDKPEFLDFNTYEGFEKEEYIKLIKTIDGGK